MNTVAKWCAFAASTFGIAAVTVGHEGESDRAVIVARSDPAKPQIPFLSWDTEDGRQARINLLRPGEGVHLNCFGDKQALEAKEAKVDIGKVIPAALECKRIVSSSEPETTIYDIWLDKKLHAARRGA